MLKFYGRRIPKQFNSSKLKLLKKSDFFFDENKINTLKKKIDIKRDVNLEIGFGDGKNILHQSQKYQDELFLGCDPYLKGSVTIEKKIRDLNIKNVFLTPIDFLSLFNHINHICFKTIVILFPDPWPKLKHQKRRLINKDFIKKLKIISNNKTKIIISTDDYDYLNQILYNFFSTKIFKLSTFFLTQNLVSTFDIPLTKYFEKAKINKIKPFFLLYQKN